MAHILAVAGAALTYVLAPAGVFVAMVAFAPRHVVDARFDDEGKLEFRS